jgi:hypothetical protein
MEGEVQEGQRTAIGTKRPAEGEHEDSDARAKFERTMDTIKDAGSKAIGVGQQATEKAAATAQSTSDRLQDAYYKVCGCVVLCTAHCSLDPFIGRRPRAE